MDITIVGTGDARDHATFHRLSAEGTDVGYISLGGNPLLSREAEHFERVRSVDEALDALERHRPDLVVVQRPSLLLFSDLVNRLRSAGCRVIAPNLQCARLEGSKVFAKEFLNRHGLPTPEGVAFSSHPEASDFLQRNWQEPDRRYVIKTDDFRANAADRVSVPDTLHDAQVALRRLDISARSPDSAGLLVEQRVSGPELSVHVLLSPNDYLILPLVADYKRLHEGDRGPNTSGMGSVATTSSPETLMTLIEQEVVRPVVLGMATDGLLYTGTLYIGVILTPDGAQILEFNVRPGNPEWVALLPLIESSMAELLVSLSTDGQGGPASELNWSPRRTGLAAHVSVPGYPFDSGKCSEPVYGIDVGTMSSVLLGEGIESDGHGYMAGSGRSFCIQAAACDVESARSNLYTSLASLGFEGMLLRRDIGEARDFLFARDGAPGDRSAVVRG